MKKYFEYIAKGFAMGASDVVPGVSGGTMALILGIYEKLIGALRSINVRALTLFAKGKFQQFDQQISFRFLLSVALGMGIAIISLSHPLEWVLQNKPAYIWAFFFGLVLASVFVLKKRIKNCSSKILLAFGLGIAIGSGITFLVPAETAQTPQLMFLSGFIAICAMLLPGISGSFLLVLLGKYEQILHAVTQRDIATLAIFMLGAVAGLLLFSKVLSWLLRHYHDVMLSLLIGLMVGSLRKIWPWQVSIAQPSEHLGIVILIAVGIFVILFLHKKTESKS